jgi:Cellulose biosynthesis protein BcsS
MFAVGGCVPSDFRAWFRVSGPRAALFLSLWLIASGTASAGPDGADGAHTEIFTGLDATDNSTQGYVGGGYAFGKGMDERGLRFRVLGAFGGYNYESGPGGAPPTQFDGQDVFGAALLGYQIGGGGTVLKLFAGIEAENQAITPHDPNNAVQGQALDLKLQAEGWLDLSERSILSVDAAYGSAFQEYWGLARVGYRLAPALSVGLEAGALGNEEYAAERGGAFLRFNLMATEIMVSGGFAGNYIEDDPSGYVSVGIYRRF